MLSRANSDRAWVSGQALLMTLVLVAAVLGPHWPAALVLAIVGAAVAVAGGSVMLWAGRTLGRALTPFPSPRGAHLERGPYRFVRHPMYGGGFFVATGVAIASSPVALAPALALVPFLLVKSRHEERLLSQADPSYGEYLTRVRRRFFPGLL
ncbi:MAG: isoprenylcysteine carboxylmethyltransferase family protein [Gaiellaceae bacterium]|jgi:protein-S-isoprenylcysteine O-methyltransferase Ste14